MMGFSPCRALPGDRDWPALGACIRAPVFFLMFPGLLVSAGANKGAARPNSGGAAFGTSTTPGKAYIAFALP
jgi:hypothetical protein